MSTKIYYAYRTVYVRDIFPLVGELRQTAQENIVKLICGFYRSMMSKVKTDTEEFKKALKGDPYNSWDLARLELANDAMREGFAVSLLHAPMGGFLLDCSFNVWQLRSRYYLHCCGNYGTIEKVFGFFGRHPKLTDYHYQNQTDRPVEVTAREWAERRRTWDELYDYHWGEYMNVNVCDYGNFYQLDPYLEMRRGIIKKQGLEKEM